MKTLFELQKWFGALVSQPLQKDQLLPQTTPFGTATKHETAKYIAPSPTLQPFERIQIYHQQYWWRLIKTLHSNFPMLLRLFGYMEFQERIAVPYLSAFLPNHWALCSLGDTLPYWLQQNYVEEDSYLVIESAKIDWATQHAHWQVQIPPIDFSKLSHQEKLKKKLHLQPFVYLFQLKADFFVFREEFLKNDPEYYNTNPFPKITYGDFYFVLYRTRKNMIVWKRIAHAEFWMLARFRDGSTIEQACEELEEMGGDLLEEALSIIPIWFKQWTVFEWFGSLSSLS